MRHFIFYTILIFSFSLIASANNEKAKEHAIKEFREHFSKHAYRGHQLRKIHLTSQECIDLLKNDGKFTDMIDEQNEIEKAKMNLSNSSAPQKVVSLFGAKAFNRMWRIAQTFRGKEYGEYKDDATYLKLLKAINNYSKIETDRGSITAGRFHKSCFAMPTAAVNTYFCLFQAMEGIEQGYDPREVAIAANNNLKDISYQSWTQPYRNDETDNNVVSVERFQKHVWWVGGNGLAFRSLLPTAAAMRSIEMMDVLSTVAKGGLTWVSQNTYDDAFWTEGFTADGAGWGHGMQCLIWGYPISGASSALNLIEYFKGTPWANQLDEENAQALINYYRGSSWYYYKGYIPRCLGRMSMAYKDMGMNKIKTDGMIRTTIDSWLTSYTDEEQKELMDLQKDIKDKNVSMAGYPDGYYTGTRWFFNNDNLIKKNPDYYTFISMASIRCDGIEMAHTVADKYNFFTCDGMTFFMKDGNEYHQAIGAWNLTAVPGVTARQVDDEKLVPMINWRGYTSKHNFAAAATSGGKNAAAGFIHEKLNASDKKDVNDRAGSDDPNDFIYDVKSYKGYFMVEDYLVALGAGITNLNPDMEGDVWTTIDQTHYNGELQYYGGENVTKISGDFTNKLDNEEIVWTAQNGGFAYAVLPEYTTGEVFLTAETRKTKWEMINKSNEKIMDLPQSEDIFQMHINHGQKVQDGSYAYVVYAGKDDAAKALDNMPVGIIENSVDLQAVTWADKYIGASFYNEQHTLKATNFEIAVSAPCAVLFEKYDDKYILSVSDAEMNPKLKAIEISTTLPVRGENVKTKGKWNTVSVPMHQNDMCGKPNTIEINF